MGRLLWLCLSIAAITLLEFYFFPGHSFLRYDTQIFVPMLERLSAPAFLSRDFVAASPHLVFTAYDEITLFLRRALHQDFSFALMTQQFICRGAAVIGVFAIASSTGVKDSAALLLAAIVNVGVVLPGALISTTEPEAVPHALCFSLCVLSIGMLAQAKPILSGLAAGIALLYHPPIAGVFWLGIIIALAVDRELRKLLRPMLTMLLVSVLLLGNLAQLQPGVVEVQSLFHRISPTWLQILRERTPEVLVSTWSVGTWLFYFAISVSGLLAGIRVWPFLNRQCKWLGSFLMACGVISLPLSWLLLEVWRWSLIPQVQPARALLFTVSIAITAASIAALHASRQRRRIEALVWGFLVLAVIVGTQVSSVVRIQGPSRKAIHDVAIWAGDNTWGGSMFYFPDAGRDSYPGVFRAESVRAVYVDWNGGELVKYFEGFAQEWRSRWNSTMRGGYSPATLESTLSLPIDYYVLRRINSLAGITPAFSTNDFVVYEVHALRNAPKPLRN